MLLERRDRLISVPRQDIPATALLFQPRLESLNDENRVRSSLSAFSRYMNTTEEISNLMEFHRKKDKPRSQINFLVSEPLSHVHYVSSDPLDGWRYIDGTYGLSIGIQREGFQNPIWIAAVGFSQQDSNSVVINMLQAYHTPDRERHEIQKNIFDNFRVERALVNLVTMWGERTGMTAVYMEPAENHAYFYRSEEERRRAMLRYNITADRLGFKKDPATDLYKFSLSNQ